MTQASFIDQHLDAMHALFDSYGVKKAWAFGSVVSQRFDHRSSDVDMLVQMTQLAPIEKGEMLLALWDALEALLDRKVDLLTEASLTNPYLRNSIDKNKRLIYDREGQKVPF